MKPKGKKTYIATDLIDDICKSLGIKKEEARKAVWSVFDHIESKLAENSDVMIRGFGRFVTGISKARVAKHPGTGKPIDVPEKKKVRFQPSDKLKRTLNKDGEKSES